jgi:hypothetical protein
MRTMYDSITAADIPASARMVAGYVSGQWTWTTADWDRFPNAVKVRIATQANVNDGHVLDVEPGDATPAQAPGWVVKRRAAGIDPTIYCNASTWPVVRAAFTTAQVAEPHYWIAKYDNVAAVLDGAVAKQYINPPTSGGHYDLSAVADYWPGVDPTAPQQEEEPMQVKAAQDGVVYVPTYGKPGLYIQSGYGHNVTVKELTWIGPTPPAPEGGAYLGQEKDWTFHADRPGPVAVPAGAVVAAVLYSSEADFTAWCA